MNWSCVVASNETVASSVGIAVVSLVRKRDFWPCFVFSTVIAYESFNLEMRIWTVLDRCWKPHFSRYHGKWNRGLHVFLNFSVKLSWLQRRGKLIPHYMTDIIYKTVKPSHLETFQMIQNINNLMFQVIFIFSDWRVEMPRFNAFSRNVNAMNLKFFPTHGGIYKLEKIQQAFWREIKP